MLSSYRVLDLTDERGQLAGMMLADAGAEVILVEYILLRLGLFLDKLVPVVNHFDEGCFAGLLFADN